MGPPEHHCIARVALTKNNIKKMASSSNAVQTEVVEFVRDTFSSSGASVSSYGRGNVVVELPADFPGISRLVQALSDTFDADCDLSTIGRNPQLTVWYPETRRSADYNSDENTADSNVARNATGQFAVERGAETWWVVLLPRSRGAVALLFLALVLLGALVLHGAAVATMHARAPTK